MAHPQPMRVHIHAMARAFNVTEMLLLYPIVALIAMIIEHGIHANTTNTTSIVASNKIVLKDYSRLYTFAFFSYRNQFL
ncbi:MAG: hypothetical protein GYA24_16410 [Candidatus Lokiarchaeota archaeon]|nr:hypothetical protein [Candidatus Lokiarchaeota archaeon]